MKKTEMFKIAEKDYNNIVSILTKVWNECNNSVEKFAEIFDEDSENVDGGYNSVYDLYSCDVDFVGDSNIEFSFIYEHIDVSGEIINGVLSFDRDVIFNPFDDDNELFNINFETNTIKHY